MSVNDLQSVADEMLQKVIEISDVLEEIEDSKELFRAATTKADMGLTFSSELGFVKTKRGSKKELTGTKPVINVTLWDALSAADKAKLTKTGLVRVEETFSQDRKPSVEVKVADAALAKYRAEKQKEMANAA